MSLMIFKNGSLLLEMTTKENKKQKKGETMKDQNRSMRIFYTETMDGKIIFEKTEGIKTFDELKKMCTHEQLRLRKLYTLVELNVCKESIWLRFDGNGRRIDFGDVLEKEYFRKIVAKIKEAGENLTKIRKATESYKQKVIEL